MRALCCSVDARFHDEATQGHLCSRPAEEAAMNKIARELLWGRGAGVDVERLVHPNQNVVGAGREGRGDRHVVQGELAQRRQALRGSVRGPERRRKSGCNQEPQHA